MFGGLRVVQCSSTYRFLCEYGTFSGDGRFGLFRVAARVLDACLDGFGWWF